MYARRLPQFLLLALAFAGAPVVLAQMPLFAPAGTVERANLPQHTLSAQRVRIDPRALQAARIAIPLPDGTLWAVRERLDTRRAGEIVWTGHVQDNPGDTVILTLKGTSAAGMLQRGDRMYRIGGRRGGGLWLYELDLQSLPSDDPVAMPDGSGPADTVNTTLQVTADGTVRQDLLVVYNDAACTVAGSCAQLESEITVAVADINKAYVDSQIGITMSLVGTARVSYTGTLLSPALSALQSTTDGQMDEVHSLRNSLGADLVAMVYSGEGCGIGYLPAAAGTAFSITDRSCLVGNRTMAHEIGHNQGAHHDRATVGTTSTTSYNYGFRRCNDASADNLGAPYFRTILAYTCSGSPRVGHFSNPAVLYSGVPTGVDPAINPSRGAFNARVLSDSAAMVASFRTPPVTTPPLAPDSLVATANGYDAIGLAWADRASDEDAYLVQRSEDGSTNWSTRATLPAGSTSWVDAGLLPQTTYYYRVLAQNAAGNAASAVAPATTLPVPLVVEDIAAGETRISGTVTGSYLLTHTLDGSAESITEVVSGGSRQNRQQAYAHAWNFDVYGGQGGVTVTLDGRISGSEGAVFSYSTDGGLTRLPMFVIDSTAWQTRSFTFPVGTRGPLRIEVRDASAVGGEPVDSVFVDRILVTSSTQAVSAPTAPTNVVASAGTTGVTVSFSDGADNELGFEIRRGSPSLADCASGTVVATLGASAGTGLDLSRLDTTAQGATTYTYRVAAFNGGGTGCSAGATVTTAATPINLSATARKVKGIAYTDLAWTGATGAVDVYREGVLRITVTGSSYSDNLGKVVGTFRYKVCATGTQSCSAERSVVF